MVKIVLRLKGRKNMFDNYNCDDEDIIDFNDEYEENEDDCTADFLLGRRYFYGMEDESYID